MFYILHVSLKKKTLIYALAVYGLINLFLLTFFNYEKFTLLFFQIFLSLCFYILFFWISCFLDPSTFVLSSYLLTLFLHLLFLFLSHFSSWRVLQFYLQISNLFLICRISSKMLSVVFLISTILSPEQIFISGSVKIYFSS